MQESKQGEARVEANLHRDAGHAERINALHSDSIAIGRLHVPKDQQPSNDVGSWSCICDSVLGSTLPAPRRDIPLRATSWLATPDSTSSVRSCRPLFLECWKNNILMLVSRNRSYQI